MARVSRIDTYVGTLAKPEKRADGTVVVEARLARSGVQVYRNTDGTERREYRSPQAVAQSMPSFRLRPATHDHPPRMLTADTTKQYSVGAVGENIRMDGIWVVAPIAIHDATAARAAFSGSNQVSAGYECDLVMGKGVSPEGEHYDARQENIEVNHVAIAINNARAGKDAAMRMDAAYTELDEPTQRTDGFMDLTQALAELAKANVKIGELSARMDSFKMIESQLAELKTRAAKLEAERDDAIDKAKKADAARTDALNGNATVVAERVQLISDATTIIGKTARIDGADKPLMSCTDRQIKLAVIKHVTNADCMDKLKGKDEASIDVYINARYDAATENAVASADTFRAANDLIERGRQNGGTIDKKRQDAATAYDEMVAYNRTTDEQRAQYAQRK